MNVYDLGKWDGYKRIDENYGVMGPMQAFDPEIWVHKIVTKTLQVPEIQLKRNQELWKILTGTDFNISERMKQEYNRIRPYLNLGLQPTNLASEDQAQENRSSKIENNRELLKEWLKFSRSFSNLSVSRNNTHTEILIGIVPDGLAGLYLSGIELEPRRYLATVFKTLKFQ